MEDFEKEDGMGSIYHDTMHQRKDQRPPITRLDKASTAVLVRSSEFGGGEIGGHGSEEG